MVEPTVMHWMMHCMMNWRYICWYMRLNNNTLVGKSLVSLLSKDGCRSPKILNLVMLGGQVMRQLHISIVDSGQFMSDMLILSGEVAKVIGEMMIGRFKLGATGLTVMKSSLEISTFGSACIQLVGKVSNCGVEMGDRVCKSGVGCFKLGASGFTGIKSIRQVSTFCSASSKLGSEITNRSVKMGNLVCQSSVSVSQLSVLSFKIVDGDISAVEFDPTGIQLVG